MIVLLFFTVASVLKYTHDYIYTKGYNKYEEQLILAVRSGKAVSMGKITVARGIRGDTLIFIEEER